MESTASIVDFVRSLASSHEVQAIAERIVSHVERTLQDRTDQVHMVVFGLGSLTTEHSARISRFQLALFERIASCAEDNGTSVPKYAVDPIFTEQDNTILSILGYSILQAQENCMPSLFLNLQECDRVICYLPHLPLHLVLSALLSAPSGSVFLCPSIKKVLELELLADPNSQLRHLSTKLKKLWEESNDYNWLKNNVITIQPITETEPLVGANMAYSCTSVYVRP